MLDVSEAVRCIKLISVIWSANDFSQVSYWFFDFGAAFDFSSGSQTKPSS